MSNQKSGQNRGRKNRGGKGKKKANSTAILPFQRRVAKTQYNYRGMPPELDRELLFSHHGVLLAGSSTDEAIFVPNSYNPMVGVSLPPAEFVIYSALYDMYRVVEFQVDIEVVNLDPKPVVAVMLFINETPVGEDVNNELGAPYSWSALLGPASGAGAKHKFSQRMRVSTLVGSNAPETDDTYRAIVNAAPGDTVWAHLNLAATPSGTSTLGVAYHVKITQWIRFYTADLTSQTFFSFVDHKDLPSEMTDQQVLDYIVAKRQARKNQKKDQLDSRLAKLKT